MFVHVFVVWYGSSSLVAVDATDMRKYICELFVNITLFNIAYALLYASVSQWLEIRLNTL